MLIDTDALIWMTRSHAGAVICSIDAVIVKHKKVASALVPVDAS